MDYNSAINSICFKFGHAVSEYDVFRWLRNFDESEWDMALNVLDKVVYYSSDRVDEVLECQLKKVKNKYADNKIYILPSSDIGKSGHVMAYHAKKLLKKGNLVDGVVSLFELKDKINENNKNIVVALLDDFSGTGKSIQEYYKKNVFPIIDGKSIVVCVITVAYMDKAKDFLEAECGFEIYGDLQRPAFIRRGSIFGYEKNMIPIRDFCFKKGEMLFPEWRNNDFKPLGYKNSQSLVCFEHTTPNNTLPILWFDGVIQGTDKKWNAIFPRFANARIDRGKRLRLSSNFWLSAMAKMKMPNIDWSKHHTTDSLRLISVVAQKYHHRSDWYIAQLLGVSMQDIEEIIKLGKEKGLIDEYGSLTQVAKTIYEEIRKKDHILEHNISKQISIQNINTVYVPKSFRGIT